jgi:hypothetical protein
MMKRMLQIVGTLALVIAASASANDNKPLLKPPLWVDPDDRNIPEPEEREVSELHDRMRNMWMRHIDLGYTARRMADRPALNVNAWDEVPDSTWFTNRIGREPVTRWQLLKGPPGLTPKPGKWLVTRLKTVGYTPGLRIRDEAGERFFIKFDLPSGPERNSAADRIGSLLMYAAGYNTPHNTIVTFRAEDLILNEDSEYENAVGKRRPMTRNDLSEAMAMIHRREDGTIRAMASHFIPGIPKGYFPYWGTRKDDPNDLIPHELRRELRGFQVIASWFNHVDVKEINSHETYVTEKGRSFLKHYLIDFGSTMGSGDFINGPCRVGYEYIFDGAAMGKSLVSLGHWERPWEPCRIVHAEVGWFEADLFDPAKWKANYPNLAFVEMDTSDGYWGAKIVTAFNDDLVRALAEAGEYSRPEVTRYVEDVFLRRRNKIGTYWLDLVTPLETIELDATRQSWTLRFKDLAIDRGYLPADKRVYHYEVKGARNLTTLNKGQSQNVGSIELEPVADIELAPTDRWGRTPLVVIDIRSNRRVKDLALPVRVVVGFEKGNDDPRVLGWAHAPKN